MKTRARRPSILGTGMVRTRSADLGNPLPMPPDALSSPGGVHGSGASHAEKQHIRGPHTQGSHGARRRPLAEVVACATVRGVDFLGIRSLSLTTGAGHTGGALACEAVLSGGSNLDPASPGSHMKASGCTARSSQIGDHARRCSDLMLKRCYHGMLQLLPMRGIRINTIQTCV